MCYDSLFHRVSGSGRCGMSNRPPEANPPGGTGEKAPPDAGAGAQAGAGLPITSVGPGSSLGWSSPRIAVQLYVELPFWLMMPEGQFEVLHGETKLKLE